MGSFSKPPKPKPKRKRKPYTLKQFRFLLDQVGSSYKVQDILGQHGIQVHDSRIRAWRKGENPHSPNARLAYATLKRLLARKRLPVPLPPPILSSPL